MNTKMDEMLKSRTVQLRISDKDLGRLAERCGRSGITIQQLLETFIGDLVGGAFYSGSDEGDLADRWFDRHGWSWMDDSLLKWLMENGSVEDVRSFLTAWNEKVFYQEHPEDFSEDWENWWDEEVSQDVDGWGGTITVEEIENIETWLKEYDLVSNSSGHSE